MARVTRIGPGVYLDEPDEDGGNHGHEIVYVAGSRGDTWAFSNGRVFRPAEPVSQAVHSRVAGTVQSLTAPMTTASTPAPVVSSTVPVATVPVVAPKLTAPPPLASKLTVIQGYSYSERD